MPLPTPANGTYELFLGGHDGHGNFAANRFIFLSPTAPANQNEAFNQSFDLVTSWVTANQPSYSACQGTDCYLNVCFARHIGVLGGAAAYDNIAEPGTGPDVSFANCVAADIAFMPGGTTNHPGHCFVWGLPVNSINGSELQPAMITLLQTLATNLIAPVVGTLLTYTLQVLSRKVGVSTPVTAYNLRPKVTGLNKRTKPFI